HSVREFAELAFASAGLDWHDYVEVDPYYFRPAEVDHLLADPSKAGRALQWEPSVTFPELVRLMVESDLRDLERKLNGGHDALLSSAQAAGAAFGRPATAETSNHDAQRTWTSRTNAFSSPAAPASSARI